MAPIANRKSAGNGTTAKQGTKPAAQQAKCRCGCGDTATKLYRPGHDACHVSQLRQQYEAGKLTRDKALAQVAHSDKLQAKLTRSLELADARIDARKAAAKAPAASKAPAAKATAA